MHPAALLALAFVLFGGALCVFRPQWVPAYFAALIYAHVSDALRGEYGLPSLFMFLAPALLLFAIVRQSLYGEHVGLGWKAALWWLVAWGAVNFTSFLYAIDRTRTAATLFDYLDAVFIVMITTLFVRRREQLGGIVWALIGAGTFLSLLTVHQTLTGNFGSHYGGFAKAELRGLLTAAAEGMRSAGPLSTNYFALILVALVPLAIDRALHAGTRLARLVAGAGCLLILGGLGATYSRGGLLTLGAVIMLMLFAAPRVPKRLLLLAPVAGAIGLTFLPATYLERMSTFGQVIDGLRGHHVEDSAIRGRISEFRSALMMIGDHPLLGVGSGNYEIEYPQYQRVIALDPRHEERAAHSLYLEVAAENGTIGLAVFGGLLVFALTGLMRTRAALLRAGDEEMAQLTMALAIAFVGFLTGSLFLHLAYPRYFWLFLGLALAVRGLSVNEVARQPEPLARALITGPRRAAEVRP
jgi:O-antigen ligase